MGTVPRIQRGGHSLFEVVGASVIARWSNQIWRKDAKSLLSVGWMAGWMVGWLVGWLVRLVWVELGLNWIHGCLVG